MKSNVKVLVLTGDGVNCERETARAFELCGAESTIKHINELEDQKDILNDFDILALPGGFSFGDELGSGKVFSLKIQKYLSGEIQSFIKKGGPVIGICNGFQVLTKLGIFSVQDAKAGLAPNSHGKFINKWVHCEVQETNSIWLKGLKNLRLPIRHGEGRIVFSKDQKTSYDSFRVNKMVALKYDVNPNGTFENIAGLSDETGLVFGLMPHPEAAVKDELYPGGELIGELGLKVFQNAVNFVQEK